MAVFRAQNNVPEVYVEHSRDFQLMCRLLDVVVNDIKFDIDSITEIINTKYCNNRLLSLLATRVGFLSDLSMDDESLRYVVKAFSYLVRHKGTITGIKDAIYVFLRTQQIKSRTQVQIINAVYQWEQDAVYDATGIEMTKVLEEYKPQPFMHLYDPDNLVSYSAKFDEESAYQINIGFNTLRKLDTSILEAILCYILPPGYTTNFFNYITLKEYTEGVYRDIDKSKFVEISNNINSQVRSSQLPFSNTAVPFIQFSNDSDTELVMNSIIGAVDTTYIIDSRDVMNTPILDIQSMEDVEE